MSPTALRLLVTYVVALLPVRAKEDCFTSGNVRYATCYSPSFSNLAMCANATLQKNAKRGINMVCPHMSYNNINKSKGGSVIASASYNKRQNIYDEIEKIVKTPKTNKDDHVYTKMLLPKGAPDRYNDPKEIWNDLNKKEKDKIAYRLIFPFQKELSPEQNREVIEKVLDIEFVSKGHPVQISYHKDDNGNDHGHAIPADRQLINGKWAAKKSETKYYLRGTIKEMDKNGKVLNPDAVILTLKDKIDTPVLTRQGYLKCDKNGNILFKKGWQKLQYDSNGKPKLDKNGKPVLIDIREPDYEPGTKIQKMKKNRNSWKPQWKRETEKFSNVSEVGGKKRVRQTWAKCLNEAFKKYQIKDKNGKILQVDFRSYEEQNKERPADEQLIPTKHVGYGFKSEKLREYNEKAKRHNAKVERLRATKQELARLEKSLADAIENEKQKTQIPEPQQTKGEPAEPNRPTKIVPASPAPTVRPNVAAATAIKTLSVIDGIAGKKVSALSGRILKKDDRPMTAVDRIIREYISDETDTIDELPTRRPKTNALKEWSRVFARSTEPAAKSAEPVTGTVSSTNDAQIREVETQAHVAAIQRINNEKKENEKKRKEKLAAAKKELPTVKEQRIAAGNEVRSQFIDFRYTTYLEDKKKLDDLKTEQDNEKQRLLSNRSSWQKLWNKKPTLSKEESKNLHQLQKQYSLAQIQINKKYPELLKYPDIPEDTEKMRHHFNKIQISVVKYHAEKMGWTDPNKTIPKYDEIHAREQYLYRILHPGDPASGQTVTPAAKHEPVPPAPDKNAEKIKKNRIEAARKRREKMEQAKENKGRPRT